MLKQNLERINTWIIVNIIWTIFASPLNPFMRNVVKWPNILLKSCGVYIAKFESIFGHFTTLCMKGLNQILQWSITDLT